VNLLLQRTIEALFPGKTAKLSEEGTGALPKTRRLHDCLRVLESHRSLSVCACGVAVAELRREQCEEEAEERSLAQARAQRGIVNHEDFGPHTDWQEYAHTTDTMTS
jgi:hypothetical protein